MALQTLAVAKSAEPIPDDRASISEGDASMLIVEDDPHYAQLLLENKRGDDPDREPLADAGQARALAAELGDRYDRTGRALQVVEVGGGYRMVTRPDVAPWLVRLARARTRVRLSRPALETLAIIAYKQPVSRPEVDAVRGVNSDGVLENLLERRLVRIAGRKDAPGRPFLYETTREFLVAFGLRDLADLPKVDGELLLPEPVAPGADAIAPTEQDPGPGGADVPPGG